MKKVLGVLGTLIIEGIIVYILAKFMGWNFIDMTLFAGICFTLIIGFFSSKGGFTSNKVRLQVQAQTGIKMDEEKFEFNMNPIFVGSIIYIIVSLLFVVIGYWKYFV
ncbi:hypothetical protein [Bacillus cereus]|uniref:hypothetical protein n=1 Tax=Bacillus cereus TaxID=1396 RepID=UPI00027953E9|nr:hypothetical protein [Bacillus cereus]EJQ98985.1 hypothetical protein II5_05727 [Bacillus cereus MSX-A1]MDR4292644.1 hypothetical protein [Bacillus cereus]PDY75140.1 hypothetical protein CON06_30960 [Bacillus cereus]PFM33675.1 hypothetical protein COJ43_25335 [Bacillus cereus]